VGPDPRVIDWAIVSCGSPKEVHYRRVRRFAPQARATVRFFCTRSGAHKVYDLWTWALES
jgi:hypothetical protein